MVASSAPNNHHPSHTSPPTPATAMRQLPLAPAPLALDLPADIDLGGTALAFTAALGEAYVAFQNYVPLILLPSPGASGWKAVPAATDATRLATVLPETACSAEAGGLRLLWMGGKGLDRNPAWWRQGAWDGVGEAGMAISCPVGGGDREFAPYPLCGMSLDEASAILQVCTAPSAHQTPLLQPKRWPRGLGGGLQLRHAG